jgi:hypothetical protein
VIIGGTHSFLVLLMLVLAPFLVAGTFGVLVFVFFSWLESRAIADTLARVRRTAPRRPELSWRGVLAAAATLPTTFAAMPPLVWLLFAVLVVAPLLLLAKLSGAAATLMLLLLVAAPLAYAYLDR